MFKHLNFCNLISYWLISFKNPSQVLTYIPAGRPAVSIRQGDESAEISLDYWTLLY